MSVNNKNWQELKKPNTLEIKEGGDSIDGLVKDTADIKVEESSAKVADEENPWDKVEKDEWDCPKELTGDAEVDEEIAYLRKIVQ